MAGHATAGSKPAVSSSSTSATTSVVIPSGSSTLTAAILKAPAGVISDIVGVANAIAKRRGFNANQTTELEQTALATSYVETGGSFNPSDVGDNGSSFGLFQLHQGGELGSLTQAQADNPVINAQTAIPSIADALSAGLWSNPGEAAVTAQRPAASVQPAYISEVDQLLNVGQIVGPGSTPSQVKVTFPSHLTAGAAADSSGSSVTNAASSSTTTDTTGVSGILTKIGGFLLALVLLGVGIVILFKDDSPTAILSKAAK